MKITAATTGAAGNWAQKALVNAGLMKEVGTMALSMIRRRTQAGTALDGGAFRPLSEGYAKQKQKNLGSTRADLSVSGRMLNDMVILETTEKTVTIGYASGSVSGARAPRGGTFIQRSRAIPGGDKALFHQVLGAGKSHVTRKFFGLNDAEKDTIRQRVQAYLDGGQ